MKINSKELRIGTDFEMFLMNPEKKFISAIPLITGTKNSPMPVDGKPGFLLQHDGVLLEMNAPPVPLDAGDEMWENIQFIVKEAKERLPKDLTIICCTNGTYEEDQLTTPEAREAGCNSSYNAFEGGALEKAPNFGETNDRCAGFHLHYSHPNMKVEDLLRLVRVLDTYTTLPLVLVDEDNTRRNLYGRIGSCRIREYISEDESKVMLGVEQRSLSNVVAREEALFKFTWKQIQRAIKAFNNGDDFLEYKERLEKAVNNYNRDEAKLLCEELGIERIEELELA